MLYSSLQKPRTVFVLGLFHWTITRSGARGMPAFGPSELKQLNQFDEKVSKLKRLVADLSPRS